LVYSATVEMRVREKSSIVNGEAKEPARRRPYEKQKRRPEASGTRAIAEKRVEMPV
jgi:hypothetical protein